MNRILIILLLISNAALAQVDLTLGLRAYYPFTGNANDVSGNNNNPSFNNATPAADRFGNANSAYQFNGIDNYMQIPNSPSLNMANQISVCAWVRVTGFYQGTCHGNSIVAKGIDSNPAGMYILRFDDNSYTNGQNCSTPVPDIIHQNFYGVGTTSLAAPYTPYIQTGQWYSVVYTYDGTTAKIYVNCELKASKTTPGLTFTSARDLFIGKLDMSVFPYWFNGTMDEVRIYDRPLNQEEVNAVGGCLTTSCNNWLSLPSHQSYVRVGDLDVPGNQITVEASFNRTAPYSNGYNWAGDLVSKHRGPIDANYLLRPNNAEITTTNGFFTTPPVCEIQLNKTYHAALVYDGATLKFYRNGFLLSSVPATGNMFQNDYQTRIGLYDDFVHNTNLIGFINEVRIWNVVRSQAQIRTHMNTSLPNPTTQAGLLAYYTFDDLINKQGNPAWNGTLGGSASINAINTSCSFISDSCAIVQAGIGGIINTYTPVLALNPCENKITVEDASTFNVGDTALIIQMKGAVIDSTNTAAFGTITDYRNAGNYEINYVKSKTGNIIELKNTITKSYNLPDGKVQLVRIPYYQNANITSTLTCLPWDGNKGGVLVLNARDTINLNANIDVSGKGFRGGNDPVTNPPVFFCYENQFFYPVNPDLASEKGEGIALISSLKSYGKGALANGGGGGNSHNSGGAGGGNTGTGGFGGYNFEGSPCTTVPFDNRGISGKSLTYSNPINKIFMGGGGGAGHTNNPEAFQARGGNGSGIAIIIADKLIANGNKIIATGDDGLPCPGGGTGCHEGMGGGGAGGSVLMDVNTYVNNITIETKGGKGADMTNSGNLKVGPGGGGGGGILWLDAATLPANITFTTTGGVGGVCTAYSNNPWGATAGANGASLFNLQIPIDNILFKPNIDSVRIKDSLLACDNFDFKGLGYTNTNAIANWQWFFGDGATATTQNTTHTYAAGSYTVKLVVTDINGCRDSITRNVTASALAMDAGPNDTICNNNSTLLQATSSGATQYAWTPIAFLNNATILNPTATPPVTTMFYLTATNAAGCIKRDSTLVTVRTANAFSIMPASNICTTKTIQLNASGGDIYAWLPAASLNNPTIFNPTASPTVTTTYSVQITDTLCNNTSTLSTTVTVIPLPNIIANKSNDLDCSTPQSQLTASGGSQYSWTPAASLNNAAIPNPIAAPAVTTQYVVTGRDATGCINYDTVIVNVSNINKGGYLMPSGFTPNNDGLNDCFGIKSWGAITDLEFSIFNRWGERIFFTKNPSDCWNGKYKGLEQDGNVFVYMIKAKSTCEGSIFRKGTFVLIR